ncbi:MAG: hypothetical protein CSYNP_01758 [Syntrophus sp. SKADARSKE-3]|nr:hypothetical protein [Syntrophus sp. SKADARSKE-3]
MIDKEPIIHVGIVEGRIEIRGTFNGPFDILGRSVQAGSFRAYIQEEGVILSVGTETIVCIDGVSCRTTDNATFSLEDVTIGVHFHWERKERQTFTGNLIMKAGDDGTLMAINELLLEDYLTSVVSSEMNGEAPHEFLKAHAIASRSWLAAMLERLDQTAAISPSGRQESVRDGEIIRWYGEDHRHFHVCADDHCQRYQGVTRMTGGQAAHAVAATRGIFLTYGDQVCDARYYKACGGLTENFENAWEDRPIPYLTSISDAPEPFRPITTEEEARAWIFSRPPAYCNAADARLLARILPDFDRETTDFFRWEVRYARETLEDLLKRKSAIDFGTLHDLIPLERGSSGRIIRLKIVGSKQTVVVGKELEIRRWLSESHLYSSAFVVSVDRDASGMPVSFTIDGAGWGHGVGLCQIGAAVMADRGFSAEAILRHYFPAAALKRFY